MSNIKQAIKYYNLISDKIIRHDTKLFGRSRMSKTTFIRPDAGSEGVSGASLQFEI